MIDKHIRTDLASESCAGRKAGALPGVLVRESTKGQVKLCTVCILDRRGAEALQKPQGEYVTLSFENPCRMAQKQQDCLSETLAGCLREMLDRVAPRAKTVLVAGLGNRRITADALGPMTTDRITVTNHLQSLDPSLFSSLGQRAVAALAPGVMGDTGVEAAKLVEKTAQAVQPDAVIAVDALCARGIDRLGKTVQLSDAGISPGSGVGNRRMALDAKTLGVPVIALGVPTVVHSETLVRDALTKAGHAEIEPAIEQVLKSREGFFVTPKDCDEMVLVFSQILAYAIDCALKK